MIPVRGHGQGCETLLLLLLLLLLLPPLRLLLLESKVKLGYIIVHSKA